MADPSAGGDLALMFLQERPDPTKSSPGLNAQMSHRLQVVSFFGIAPGSRILELGCGQGDTTIALAHAVGPTGHIGKLLPLSLK
jgi:predicted methyltransferase